MLHVLTPDGPDHVLASAVVDASGTWRTPNPWGRTATGCPARCGTRTGSAPASPTSATLRWPRGTPVGTSRSPAPAPRPRTCWSALSRLAEQEPTTRVSWLVRRDAVGFGGGEADQLAERGALGLRALQATRSASVDTRTGFRTTRVDAGPDGRLRIGAADGQVVEDVDEVVVVTGFRPDLAASSEVRLDLDPVLQAPRALAPLIDPNQHSCGTVYPHGAAELAQPEPGLYLAGTKSYGRATSFLALTGFEQVRSVVAAVAGDHEAASRVELVLPETGVCSGSGQDDGLVLVPTGGAAGGCCA